MMCEEIMCIPRFSRENVAAILQKITPVDVDYVTVKYGIYHKGDIPAGWQCSMPLKKEICSVGGTWPTDSLTTILDLPEIKADCSNLYKIRIDTTKYRYDIDVLSSSVTIYGPDMPFSPADLVAAGVKLSIGGFVYKC